MKNDSVHQQHQITPHHRHPHKPHTDTATTHTHTTPPPPPWTFWLKASPMSRSGALGSFRSVGTRGTVFHMCQRLFHRFQLSFSAFFDVSAHFEPCCRSRLWCSWYFSWSVATSSIWLFVIFVSSLFWSFDCVHDVWEAQGSYLFAVCWDGALGGRFR